MISNFLEHIDACPTAHHVVDRAASILRNSGIDQVTLDKGFTTQHLQSGFVSSGGTIIAWKNAHSIAENGIRIVGAHTDSILSD